MDPPPELPGKAFQSNFSENWYQGFWILLVGGAILFCCLLYAAQVIFQLPVFSLVFQPQSVTDPGKRNVAIGLLVGSIVAIMVALLLYVRLNRGLQGVGSDRAAFA